MKGEFMFSKELKECILNSKKEMNELKHSYIGSEHFILAILNSNNNLSNVLYKYEITYERFKQSIIDLIGYGDDVEKLFIYTPLFKKILEDSINCCADTNSLVTLENVFLNLLDEAEGVAYRIFCEYGIDIDSLYDEIDKTSYKISNKTKYIEEVGIDICKKALNHELDPVVGRDKEVDRLIEIICRKNKRNPLLIGEAGVGKTSIVEELANRIVNNNVPSKLLNKKIVSISMASLVSGTKYRGEFEEKVLRIFDEIEKDNDIIVFIDEIHTLVGAGGADGAIDASNILKPALARGKIVIIGATTTYEYNKYIEKDKALSRRFQTVLVNEPSENELLKILAKIKTNYEEYHNVIINNDIISYIVKLSKIYLPYRKEPDKSIDILDEACSKASIIKDEKVKEKEKYIDKLNYINIIKNNYLLNNDYKKLLAVKKEERKILSDINKLDFEIMNNKKKKIINKDIINSVITTRSNIPVYNCKTAKNVLKKLKKELKTRFVTENEEINKLVEFSEEVLSIEKKEKPKSILFIGSKDRNKKELANLYGKYLFNDKIIDLDLSIYSSSNKLLSNHSVFSSIKENPFSLIIVTNYYNSIIEVRDVIDKILKDSKLELEDGMLLHFNNSVIIFIEDTIKSSIGFNNKSDNINRNVDKIINFEVLINQ